MHALVIFTAKSKELRGFRRSKEDSVCGSGCAERKNQRGKKRGKWEMGIKAKQRGYLSFVETVSGLSLYFMLRKQVNKRDKCEIEEIISSFQIETCSTINTHSAESPMVNGSKCTL